MALRALLLLLCIAASTAYYVPGTYPQEFFANAEISGAGPPTGLGCPSTELAVTSS